MSIVYFHSEIDNSTTIDVGVPPSIDGGGTVTLTSEYVTPPYALSCILPPNNTYNSKAMAVVANPSTMIAIDAFASAVFKLKGSLVGRRDVDRVTLINISGASSLRIRKRSTGEIDWDIMAVHRPAGSTAAVVQENYFPVTTPNPFDGSPHRLKLRWKMSASGGYDGLVEAWCDDTLIGSVTGLNTKDVPDYPAYYQNGVNVFYFGVANTQSTTFPTNLPSFEAVVDSVYVTNYYFALSNYTFILAPTPYGAYDPAYGIIEGTHTVPIVDGSGYVRFIIRGIPPDVTVQKWVLERDYTSDGSWDQVDDPYGTVEKNAAGDVYDSFSAGTAGITFRLTPIFTPIGQTYTLTVVQATGGNITIEGGPTYPAGVRAIIHAVPNSGYVFTNWVLNGQNGSTDPNGYVTMDANHTISAVFTSITTQSYIITMNAGTPAGEPDTSYSPPSNYHNISPPGTYTIPIVGGVGELCAFKVLPPIGYTFVRWDWEQNLTGTWVNKGELGGVGGSTNPDTFNANTAGTQFRITPIFATSTRLINFTSSPTGVTANIGGQNVTSPGSVQVLDGSTINIAVPREVIALARHQFQYFIVNGVQKSGTLVGSDMQITETITADTTVEAVYQEILETWLLVMQTPVGQGSVTPAVGSSTHTANEAVTIQATPSSGWRFDHWIIDGTNYTTNPASVSKASGQATVQAVFTLIPIYYTLSITQTPNGTITANPSGGSYLSGTSVQLTATPASGYKFDGWSGALSGLINPQSLIMNGNKAVSGSFSPLIVNTPPQITYATVWSYESSSVISPGGSVSAGNMVRMCAGVADVETPSNLLTVHITYRGQRIRALWEPLYDGYWYVEWSIPQSEPAGLITIQVEASDPQGLTASPLTTTFNISAYIPPDYAVDPPGQYGYVIWFSPRTSYYYVKYTPDGTIVSGYFTNLTDAEAWRSNHLADVKVEDYATHTIWRTYDSSSYFVRDGSGAEVARYPTLVECENWVRNTLPDEKVDDLGGYQIWATYHIPAVSYGISPTSYYITRGGDVKVSGLPTIDEAIRWIAANPVPSIGIPIIVAGTILGGGFFLLKK